MKSVLLPGLLKTVEDDTFKDCKNLKEAWLPDGLELIGAQAFMKCGLKNVSFPACLRRIGSGAFGGCRNLTDVEFREESMLEEICYGSFVMTGLERIELPASLNSIGKMAFFNNDVGPAKHCTLVLWGAPRSVADDAF